MKVNTVRGIVMAQYRRNCGVEGTDMDSPLSSLAASQSKQSVEKSAEMKLPGKKSIVTNASVFIDDASR